MYVVQLCSACVHCMCVLHCVVHVCGACVCNMSVVHCVLQVCAACACHIVCCMCVLHRVVHVCGTCVWCIVWCMTVLHVCATGGPFTKTGLSDPDIHIPGIFSLLWIYPFYEDWSHFQHRALKRKQRSHTPSSTPSLS